MGPRAAKLPLRRRRWKPIHKQTKPTAQRPLALPRPPFLGSGAPASPPPGFSPPPSTSGHVPLAARATHGGALNLSPPGAELKAGAARAARTAGGGEARRDPGPAAPPGGG